MKTSTEDLEKVHDLLLEAMHLVDKAIACAVVSRTKRAALDAAREAVTSAMAEFVGDVHLRRRKR